MFRIVGSKLGFCVVSRHEQCLSLWIDFRPVYDDDDVDAIFVECQAQIMLGMVQPQQVVFALIFEKTILFVVSRFRHLTFTTLNI